MASAFLTAVALAKAVRRKILLAALCSALAPPAIERSRAAPRPAPKPSILLVTLDTTRADAIGPEAAGVETPAFNAIAARGRRFRQAYATVPETLPSHASMLIGPLSRRSRRARERALRARDACPLAAERLQQAGYRTSAFVSSFVLARRFGLARGFDVYDDDAAGGRRTSARRRADDRRARSPIWREPSDAAAFPLGPLLRRAHPVRAAGAVPHADTRSNPYLGEVAAMDEQLGRLVAGLRAPGEGPGRDRRSSRITAKASASMAKRSTATCCISPRCTCRWCSWGQGSTPGVERHAGQHAPDLSHAAGLGRPRTRVHSLRSPATVRKRSCSARR